MMTVRVPATSANLGPGFDSFGVAIDLYLTAHLATAGEQRVVTQGEGEYELPGDDGNLVWRAFSAGCERFGIETPEVTLVVDNDIPLERGLGSSSAAIVAGVTLARSRSAAPVGDRMVLDLADELEGHPDNVAPAILGGLTVCTRADDARLVVRRANPHQALQPVVFVPERRQSTVEARGVLPDSLSAADVAQQAGRAGHVIGALLGAWPADPSVAGDRLHEPPRLAAMGASRALVDELRAAGIHAWLSGAGPTVTAAARPRDLDRCATIAANHTVRMQPRRWDLAGALVRD